MRSARQTVLVLVATLPLVAGCGTIGKIKNTANAIGDINKDTAKIQAEQMKAQTLTFTAVYTSTDSDKKTTTMTVAQKPPKSVLMTDDGSEFIDDGTNLTTCEKASDTDEYTCTSLASSVPGGFFGGAFAGVGFGDPLAFLDTLKLAAAFGGFRTSSTSETFAGQKADCVAFDKPGDDGGHFKSCVTADGIVALTQTSDGDGANASELRLTRYEKSVKDSVFTPPAKPEDLGQELSATPFATDFSTAYPTAVPTSTGSGSPTVSPTGTSSDDASPSPSDSPGDSSSTTPTVTPTPSG